MWFLAILVLLNAFANNETVVNKYRLDLGVPINMFDALLVLGFGLALIFPRLSGRFYQTDRVHTAMLWLLGLFTGALMVAMVGSMWNEVGFVRVLTAARNLLAIPAAIYLGYFLTANFNSARWFLHVTVLAGVVATFMVLFFFKEKGQSLNTFQSSVTDIRAVAYVAAYAGLAVGLLFYSIASGYRLYSLPIALLLAGWCLLGSFFTLSRSDWLATMTAGIAAFFCLPRERRGRNLFTAIVAMPVLMVSLYVGLWVGSQVTRQDMLGKMYSRIETMLPGERAGVKHKAWETRLPGIRADLNVFFSNPLMGGGLAIQDNTEVVQAAEGGTRHCSWTAAAAEQGILGLGAAGLMIFGTAVIGRRMLRTHIDPAADRTLVLVGALGVVTCAFYAMHGLTTMSWNQVRYGLPLFIVVGVVLRTRAMQLTYQRQVAEYEAEAASYGQDGPEYHQQPDYMTEEPVFGNWYQTN